MLNRQSRLFAGSAFKSSASACDESWYTLDIMMSLWSRLSFQSPSMNSLASQSSNSGCVGCSPSLPKSFVLGTMPRPKWYCQTRFTNTRAVSGLSFDAIQSASTVRRPLDLRTGLQRSGIFGLGQPQHRGEAGLHFLTRRVRRCRGPEGASAAAARRSCSPTAPARWPAGSRLLLQCGLAPS